MVIHNFYLLSSLLFLFKFSLLLTSLVKEGKKRIKPFQSLMQPGKKKIKDIHQHLAKTRGSSGGYKTYA